MNKTFEEAKNVEIDDRTRRAFEGLGRSRDFAAFRKLVEGYVLKLTHNLVVGTAVSRDARYEALDELAGFSKYWKKMTDLVDNKDHYEQKSE